MAMPVILVAIMLIVHTLAPNSIPEPPPFFYEGYTFIELSNAWTVFLSIILAGFLIWFIIALFFEPPKLFLTKYAPLCTAVLALIFLYDVLSLHLAALNTMFFPWPERILNAMLADASILFYAWGNSIVLLMLGYIIGAAAGILSGVIAGYTAKARYWVRPLARFFSAVPVITLVPIFIFIPFDFFLRAILLISIAVWVPVTLIIMNGVMAIPKNTFEAAKTFGLKNHQILIKVAIPAASPAIFNGLSQGMAIACVALIIAETMGVAAGIGHYIGQQDGIANYAGMYGAVIVLGTTFAIINLALIIAKKILLKHKGDNV